MMKGLYLCSVVTVAISIMLDLAPVPASATGKTIHKTYNQRLIKSRAARNYTNNGTVIYNYQEIDSYDDKISGEEIGNILIDGGSRIREVHNVIIIKDDVESDKDNLDIGKVSVSRSGRIQTINNSVTIDGKVDTSGESMKIGTVQIDRGGRVRSLDNKVVIDGEINAR